MGRIFDLILDQTFLWKYFHYTSKPVYSRVQSIWFDSGWDISGIWICHFQLQLQIYESVTARHFQQYIFAVWLLIWNSNILNWHIHRFDVCILKIELRTKSLQYVNENTPFGNTPFVNSVASSTKIYQNTRPQENHQFQFQTLTIHDFE